MPRPRDQATTHGAHSPGELLPLVYDELRRLAESRLGKEGNRITLQATALVHEAYVRLLGPDVESPSDWDGRGHFFSAAAEAMRRILIERARARSTVKRGGEFRRLDLDPACLFVDQAPEELVELDEALERLSRESAEKAELVKLRFFAGLTMNQAAQVLGISISTADRHWAYARAWLYAALDGKL